MEQKKVSFYELSEIEDAVEAIAQEKNPNLMLI